MGRPTARVMNEGWAFIILINRCVDMPRRIPAVYPWSPHQKDRCWGWPDRPTLALAPYDRDCRFLSCLRNRPQSASRRRLPSPRHPGSFFQAHLYTFCYRFRQIRSPFRLLSPHLFNDMKLCVPTRLPVWVSITTCFPPPLSPHPPAPLCRPAGSVRCLTSRPGAHCPHRAPTLVSTRCDERY
jgi:hypothetical protein